MTSTWRNPLLLGLTVVVGLVAFGWPFVVQPGSTLANHEHGSDASLFFLLLMVLMAAATLADLASGGMDAKTVAVLGVLAAAGAALRVFSAGTVGLEPMFFLLVIAGRALGPVRAFTLGAITMLASAFLTAGVGPWTPFQMIGAGWVALGAALLPKVGERGERWLLASYGMVAGLAYGALLNLWFWPFAAIGMAAGTEYVPGGGLATNLAHYAVFYVTTSLLWDLPRGLLTGVLTLVAARPLLRALRRSLRVARFDAVATFEPAEEAR